MVFGSILTFPTFGTSNSSPTFSLCLRLSLSRRHKRQGHLVSSHPINRIALETGNVDAGIVYKTDALVSSKVEIVATAKENTHASIIYPVGVIKNSSHTKEAKLFYEYLQNGESKKTFEKYGFKGLN
jgi:molybdate transport system substrate-binding protein